LWVFKKSLISGLDMYKVALQTLYIHQLCCVVNFSFYNFRHLELLLYLLIHMMVAV